MTRKRMPDVAEIEDCQEAVQFVASVIEDRRTQREGVRPEQLRHLAAALTAAADGDVERAKERIEDALRADRP